jgi:hypothetical protein
MVKTQIMEMDDEPEKSALKPKERALLDSKVSRAFCAALFNTTRKTISVQERAGVLHPNPDGTYFLGRFTLQWGRYLATRHSNARADTQAELTRLRIAQARLKTRA